MKQIVEFLSMKEKRVVCFIYKTNDIHELESQIKVNKLAKISFSPFSWVKHSPLTRAFHVSVNFVVIMIMFFFYESCGTSENQYHLKAKNIKNGEILFQTDGCFVCHSITGEVKYGPALNNILNTKINVTGKSGQYSIVINREYIFRSIKDPEVEKMIGFQNKRMPQPSISEEDMNFLTDYIISINLKQAREK